MSQSNLQLLAFVDAPVGQELPDAGLGRLRSTKFGPHYALVRETPAGEYDGPDAEQKFADLEWISRRAMAHQQALDAASREVATCPLPLGVLFSGHDALEDFAARNEEQVAEFFQLTTGRQEYGVKLLQKPGATRLRIDQPATNGADRLRQKLAAKQGAQRRSAETGEFVESLASLLSSVAPEVRRRKVMGRSDEDEATPIAGFAVLANQQEGEALGVATRDAKRQAERLGVLIEVTGPWPPYAFCPELA